MMVFLEHKYRYPRLRIVHSLKQKEYVDWLYSEFKDFCVEKPHPWNVVDKRNGKVYPHYLFATQISPVFMEYRKIFYPQGKKIVPSKIENLLKSEISLAVWYMDDGFKRTDCRSLYLCTSGFSLDDQRFLQSVLYRRYGFDTKIHFAGKNARIYFPVRSASRFCGIVKPHILPVFHYKLF